MSFDPPNPFAAPGASTNDSVDVVTIATIAARTRNASELSAKIKASGGALVTDINSSDYIVAVNNGLRYSVTKLSNGQYRITESMNWLLLLGVAGIVSVALLSRR